MRADGTYLVTGGWGALGRITATLLARAGARHLVLLGRRAPNPVPAWIEELRAHDVEVVLREADVADDAAVGAVVREIAETLPPLRGVVHSAGTTDDAPLENLDRDRFDAVFAAKVRGAWHLHRHTRTLPLDFFVLFSSVASVLGSAGQANYVLANAYLDALATARRHEGLPALSLNWGPFDEAGIAVRGATTERLARAGLHGISESEGARALARALSADATQLALAKVDWQRYAAATVTTQPRTLLADFDPRFSATATEEPGTAEIERLACADPDAAEAALVRLLLRETAMLLDLEQADRRELEDDFAHARFDTLGLDSLMSVRLRNRLLRELSVAPPDRMLVDGSTVADVARDLSRRLAVRQLVAAPDGDEATGEVEVVRL